MSRKILFCFLALALVSNTNAASKMFGNWEDSNDGYVDWSDGSITTMPSKYIYVTTGATLGNKALKMVAPVGWQQNLAIRSYESPYGGYPNTIVQGFLDNQYLAVDVTFVTADWVSSSPGNEFATVEMNICCTNVGWENMGRPDQDTGNPGYPGGWDATHFGAMQTRTMYWDIAYLHDGNFDNKEFTGTPTSGFVTLIFQTDSGGFSSGGVYYFDNVRFVTELATIVLYVDANAAGANNGSSWTDAYKYLQDALTSAEPNDMIWVAQGTYKPDANTAYPNGTGSRTATFQLKNSVAIYGGFPTGGGLWGSRDPGVYETILSGDIGTPDVNTDNSYHVITGSGTDSTAILDGFNITAGNANGSEPYNYGGGMYNNESSPTVTDCTFSGNSANRGGGMDNDHSNPTLTNCTFSGNSANIEGGGMYNNSSSPTVINCTFSGNSAAQKGGGMCNYGSSPTLTNCSFSGNSVTSLGGGMYNINSNPMVTNCTFSGNSATNGLGGGMYNDTNSSLTVTNCTFSSNSAKNNGGGMYNKNSSPTLANCILWGNTSPNGEPQIYNYGTSSPVVSYCDVQGGYSGIGNINSDPLFVDANNLRLSPDSPCIDKGNNASVPVGVTTDLDGHPRKIDGDCNSTVIVDMGAYEFSWVLLGDFDSDCDIDLVDFAILAKAWLTEPPDPQWNQLCDIGTPPDNYIDWLDLDVLAEHWLQGSGE